MNFGPAVGVPDDASAARWIAPALGRFATMGGLVPAGDAACVLLDHRAGEEPGFAGVARRLEGLAQILEVHSATPEAPSDYAGC